MSKELAKKDQFLTVDAVRRIMNPNQYLEAKKKYYT